MNYINIHILRTHMCVYIYIYTRVYVCTHTYTSIHIHTWASQVALVVKNLPTNAGNPRDRSDP